MRLVLSDGHKQRVRASVRDKQTLSAQAP